MKASPTFASLIAFLAISAFAASAAASVPAVSITASSSSISAGQSDTLTVTESSAASIHVTGSNGTSYSMPYSGGTITVTPSVTTTYTATATNGSGSTSAQTTVTVGTSTGGGGGSGGGTGTGTGTGGAPNVSITSSSSTISAGQSDPLTVTASSAGSVHVTGSDGTSYSLPYSGGTISVTPSSTTTYTAAATNSHGSTSAQITVTVGAGLTTPTVTITAQNSSISPGSSDTLTVTAANSTTVVVTGSDGSSYTLSSTGGTQAVTPTATTTYTAEASNAAGTIASAETTIAVGSSAGLSSIQHVVFMLQENHSFDNYFGMLNPYRKANGWSIGDDGKEYDVDGIDDKLGTISNEDDQGTSYPLFKLRSTCVDDMTSAWLESSGDVSRWDFTTTRPIRMDGFVHTAEGFSTRCNNGSSVCSGQFTDTTGERAMGYYDDEFLNYYYYMASQFAVSDRWFSPVSSKSIPNRIATFTGGTTQGLVFDPGGDDHLPQLSINNIFEELQNAGVSWRIYYTTTQGSCLADDPCGSGDANYPDTTFESLGYSFNFMYQNPSHAACTGTTKSSSVVGDTSNSFCIDPNHIAPLSTFYTDIKNGALPAFAFIESGSGKNDEHPGSGQSVLTGQAEVATIVNAFMVSPVWASSVFFFSYDEGGGPYDHVPPVPGHSNQNTDSSLGSIPDISAIAVNPDSYFPCLPSSGHATTHCDLLSGDPGTKSADAAAQYGFGAQLGFRLPNIVISPFARRHYVSHIPMDHTAVIKLVEDRFIGSSAHLTARDAAQPNLLDFFDFTAKPWATPPSPPTPVSPSSLGYNPCLAQDMGP